jgi:putative ABC transport system permease protein
LACIFVISAWTIQELRFDRFHHQSKHIYMLTTDIKDNTGNLNRFPETPAPLAQALEEQIPAIENGFHFLYLYGKRTLGTAEITFKEEGIAASPEFLEVFNFPLISGRGSELADPGSIFLSQRLADKLFPGGSPVGKELLYKDDLVLVVKGVFKNVPRNSSLQFDFLIPYEIEYGISEEWWQLSDASFIKTASSADMEKVHILMKDLWREKITDDQYNLGLIPIVDLRYGADFEFFNVEHGHGSRKKLFMFIGVAILILILACLNYVNLISAYAIKRENETWIRKVHGASAGNITNYLMIESVMLSIFAWVLASLLSWMGLHLFEKWMGVVIDPNYFFFCIAFGLILAVIIVGLASGFYPAFRAGSDALINPGEARKPDFMFQRRLRNAFVMSQFVLSIALSISNLIIVRQADFMMDFETGYAKQDIVEFSLPARGDTVIYDLDNWLNANPNVEVYSFGSSSPVSLTVLNTIEKWTWEGLQEGAHTSFYRIAVDEEYLTVFQIPLVEGIFFSSPENNQDRIVINETLAGLLGFEDPVGQIIRRGETEYEIIGVVRDFNFQHLRNEIRPLLFTYSGSARHLFVKIKSNASETLGQTQEHISDLYDKPIGYSFVIEEYNKLYLGEQQIISAILFFTILSILLSSLGLIGVVSHANEARAKEIAVRKVFGAETCEMMLELNVGILKIFLPSLFFGSLLAWLVMQQWLMDYAHRREFEGWVFLLGASIILIIALLSVSFQTWRASNRSPAAALKNL